AQQPAVDLVVPLEELAVVRVEETVEVAVAQVEQQRAELRRALLLHERGREVGDVVVEVLDVDLLPRVADEERPVLQELAAEPDAVALAILVVVAETPLAQQELGVEAPAVDLPLEDVGLLEVEPREVDLGARRELQV